MLNDWGLPIHPFALGVTVTVPEILAFVVLVAVNAVMSPFPLAGKPMSVFEFVLELHLM